MKFKQAMISLQGMTEKVYDWITIYANPVNLGGFVC